MRPAALSLVVLLALAAPASAQLVRGVDIVEQGIYTADIDRTVRGTDGLFRNVLSNICHVVDTDTIPARLGLHFGFRYRLNGTEGQTIDVRKITVFPRAMMPPGAVRPIAQTEHVFRRAIGSVSFTGYAFDEPPELVPGIWQFQMWHSARMLSEMKFSVIEDNGMRLPRASNANCFRVSSL
ncbi:MAG TPA: DUF3859 domain-containing protein [Reyranellaceae bacterium]|nr:DUF3859 domain-containing protein [Reyranellaceae bacterium]